MADLCESSESEDISSFFQNFLQNSSSLANTTTCTASTGSFLRGFGGGEASAPVAEFSSSQNFSDPGNLFPNEAKGFGGMTSSVNRGEFASENLENLSFSCEEGSEAAEVRATRRSSKRSRAAEVHNMSEKRRRSRINEKLKALQTLIPNSNKTDKASMLDEAIEYLKQLQLQVQMLTMRNRLSLHPGYTLGSLQAVLPSSEFDVDEGNVLLNTNRGADTSFRDQEIFMQNAVGSSGHASSMQPIPSNFIPSMHNHNGIINPLPSSEDISRDAALR